MSATKWMAKQLPHMSAADLADHLDSLRKLMTAEKNAMKRGSLWERIVMCEAWMKKHPEPEVSKGQS